MFRFSSGSAFWVIPHFRMKPKVRLAAQSGTDLNIIPCLRVPVSQPAVAPVTYSPPVARNSGPVKERKRNEALMWLQECQIAKRGVAKSTRDFLGMTQSPTEAGIVASTRQRLVRILLCGGN